MTPLLRRDRVAVTVEAPPEPAPSPVVARGIDTDVEVDARVSRLMEILARMRDRARN